MFVKGLLSKMEVICMSPVSSICCNKVPDRPSILLWIDQVCVVRRQVLVKRY